MEDLKLLSVFFQAIEKDLRIGTTHIAIYAALLRLWMQNEMKTPLQAYSAEVQMVAKISSPKTYHRCIRELDSYGYLIYIPTKNKNKRSSVYFHLK